MAFFREYINVSFSYVIYIIGALLALILQLYLARIMGAYQYGIYSFVLSCLMIISLLPRFGLDTILTRYLSEYYVKQEWGKFHGILSFCYKFSALISVSLLLLLYVFLEFIELNLDFNIDILKVGLLCIPVLCFAKFNQSCIQSLKKPVLSLIGNLVISPLLVLTGLVLIYYLSTPVADVLIWIYCMSVLLSYAIMMGVLEKILISIPAATTRIYLKKEWIIASLPLFISSGLNVLLGRVDILMLGFMADSREVGIYTIASLVATPISFILIAINNVLAPEVSSLYQMGKIGDIQEHLTKYMRVALVVTIPCVVVVLIAGRFILLFFGKEFTEGYASLLILTTGQFMNVLMGSVGLIMSMTNRQKLSAVILGFAVFINILLNIILIPYYGKVGASLATSLTIMLWNYLMYLNIRKSLAIDPSGFRLLGKLF